MIKNKKTANLFAVFLFMDTTKQTIPPICLTSDVQVEDIRDMLLDAIPADYVTSLNDFYFSDEEIIDGMKRCLEVFNETPPINIKIGYRIFGQRYKYTFKIGTCWQVYKSKYLYFMRKTNPYTAGGVAVDTFGNQAKLCKQIADDFKTEFIPQVMSIKRTINLNNSWGVIG